MQEGREASTAGMPAGESSFFVGPDDDPDRYRLSFLHSSGGEGQIWRGTRELDGGVELSVAVKTLHTGSQGLIAEWRTQWAEQVELLRSLQYPGVVPVREAFEGRFMHPPGEAGPNGRALYLVMNWIDGESLHEWVSRRPDRDVFETVRLLTQTADALDYMHSGRATGGKAVLHRDVKPANIIVTEGGAVLVDFGLVRALSAEPLPAGLGTPRYIAPEVVTEGSYSPASDRYSLGCAAYYALTGEDPPPGNDLETMRASLATVPALGANRGLVDHLTAMLDPNPEARPSPAAAWMQPFRNSTLSETTGTTRVRPGRPAVDNATSQIPAAPSSRRWAMAGVAVLAVLLAGGLLFAAIRPGPRTEPTASQRNLATTPPSEPTTVATTSTSTIPTTTATTLVPPLPDPPNESVLKTILLTANDTKIPLGESSYATNESSGRNEPVLLDLGAAVVCDGTEVSSSEVVADIFQRYSGSANVGSEAASFRGQGASKFMQDMKDAATRCGKRVRAGPTLGEDTVRFVDDPTSSSSGFLDHIFMRRGVVVVEVALRTDSGQHSYQADQLAAIAAQRLRAI